MLCDSTNSTGVNADLYLIAGFRTAPLFMEEFRLALHGRLEKAGVSVRSKLLFPYGDWSRRPVAQLLEIRRDMGLGVSGLARSIGGRNVLKALEADGIDGENEGAGDRLPILIGHSGGGVAAVHAASLLHERKGGEPCPVVMIGSPKCRIPEALRGSVLYLQAAGKRAKGGSREVSSDPVTRLGSFGGWQLSGGKGWRVWRRDKHAPETIASVPVAGGHADYFRSQAPFIDDEGRSNLDRISEAVWQWLTSLRLMPPPEARGR